MGRKSANFVVNPRFRDMFDAGPVYHRQKQSLDPYPEAVDECSSIHTPK